jgi:hypothetical protein
MTTTPDYAPRKAVNFCSGRFLRVQRPSSVADVRQGAVRS